MELVITLKGMSKQGAVLTVEAVKVMENKKCTKCNKVFPATREFFHYCKRSSDGFKSDCIDCRTKLGRRKKWDGILAPNQPSKLCKTCEIRKPLSEFTKEEFGDQGRRGKCKKCEKKRRRELRILKLKGLNTKPEIVYSGQTKVCTRCKEEKPIEIFYRVKVSKKCPSGYYSRCKPCACLEAKKFRKRRKEGLVGLVEKLPKGKKRCTNCNNVKSHSEFNNDRSRKDDLFPWCKECTSQDQFERQEKVRKELGIERRITESWDKASEEILIAAHKKELSFEEIQKKYFKSRSLKSIEAKTLRLGLRSPITWESEDDNLLRIVFKKTKDYKEIQKSFPKRSIPSLKARCWKLNLTEKKSPPWTEEEDIIVKEQIKSGKTIKDFCSLLPKRSESGINGRIQVLGLKAIEIRKKINAERIANLTHQECVECNTEKPIEEFYRTQSGYMLTCKQCRGLRFEEYRENYKPILSKKQKAKRLARKKESADKLNEYYINHEVPHYIWHEDEFPTEEDFQRALEHTLVNLLKLRIEPWVHLEGIGYPDIYIPSSDLFVEVKLLGDDWSSEHIKEQVSKYQEISPVVLVSLDGKPKKWNDDICEWFTPDELFNYLEELK